MMRASAPKSRPRYILIVAGLLVVAVLAAAAYVGFHGANTNKLTLDTPVTNAGLAHIFVIVEENKLYSAVTGGSQAPFLSSLAKKHALATNYTAITNPSLPNYIALTSGSTQGITTDCNPPRAGGCIVDARNIADEIERSGRTWKMYAEGMPTPCGINNAGNYATKHVPFLYYSNIADNADRCTDHVVPFSQLASDVSSDHDAPDFAFIAPDMCNDTHDCPLATGDAWLAQHVPDILESKAFTEHPSLLVITWDEGNTSDNHIATIFAGSGAKTGFQSAAPYNHYSLLRTIEKAWDLPPLTQNDRDAKPMDDMLSPDMHK